MGFRPRPCTLATVLKALGYTTGQFGKNHLGDLNKYLPTVHGFDEYFGYLYHLDAMSDPYWFDYPQDWIDKTGRVIWCIAGRPTLMIPPNMPRWGKVGKQRIVDEGPLAPFPDMRDMRTGRKAARPSTTWRPLTKCFVKTSEDFMDKAKQAGKPFFIWHNTTRMHVFTYFPPKYQAMMNRREQLRCGRGRHGAMDDSVGALLKHLEDIGEAENTIVIFTTDNGAEVFTWPDGGMTPFKATKGTVMKAASGYPPSSAGRARLSLAPSRTGSSPGSIGSPRW